MRQRTFGFWFLQSSGWLFLVYLVYAQGIPAFNYDFGVATGTQEPAAQITEVGVAFWKGFAIGDAAFYIPLLLVGLAAFAKGLEWGRALLLAASGITVYWSIVCLAAVAAARGAAGWDLPKESDYWVVLPLIAVWGGWCLWWLTLRGNKA